MSDKSKNKDDPKDIIELDILRIDAEIKKNKKYTPNPKSIKSNANILIEFLDYNDESNKSDLPSKYKAKIKSKYLYIGALSKELSKESYGYYNYGDDGDEYIGQWSKDEKNGIGVYKYSNQSRTTSDFELYIGEWVKGKKIGKGCYIWQHEPKGEKLNDAKSFDCFLGNFQEDQTKKFTDGIKIRVDYVKKQEQDQEENWKNYKYSIYIGQYDDKGNKNDDKGIIVEDNKIFYGKVEEDVLTQGKMTIFKKEEGKIIEENSYSFIKKEIDDYEFSVNLDKEPDDDKIFNVMNNVEAIDYVNRIEEIFYLVNHYFEAFQKYDELNIQDYNKFSEKINEFLDIINIPLTENFEKK